MKTVEAKSELRKRQNELRRAEIVMEMHENGVRELREDIEKLKAIIKKKDDWMEKLVDPKKDKHFYISTDITSRYGVDWLTPAECKRNAALLFREESHAKIMANKIQLMQEMHAFAHVRNEGWMPDWRNVGQVKHGIVQNGNDAEADWFTHANSFVFGVVVKSKKIAEEMLEIFGERIEKFYNKQY